MAKGRKRGENFKIVKLTLAILELQMKCKKKVLGVLNGSFLVDGGNNLFNFFKRGNL